MPMILSLLLAAQADTGKLPPAAALPPPDFETAAVMAPINALFAAFERAMRRQRCASFIRMAGLPRPEHARRPAA
jgi:hypothetical protein